MNDISPVLIYITKRLQNVLKKIDVNVIKRITEIRLRRNKPLILVIRNCSYFINYDGDLSTDYNDFCVVIKDTEFDEIFMEMCSYSVYSNIDEMKKGYITLDCGARAGIASTAVYNNGVISSVKDVTSINLRIPRAVKGSADNILNCLYINSFPSVIIAGKPNSGKTTLLRDMAIQLSSGFNGLYRKVCVIDERMEFFGKNEKSVLEYGVNADVLSGFKKDIAIEIATRTLSPEIIICDEISTIQEVESISFGFSTGIRFALSVHAENKKELQLKPIMRMLLSTGCFSYIILLDEYTYSNQIIDANEVLYENGGGAYFDNIINGGRSIVFKQGKNESGNM